jgi:CheY-like chemotaxis protein
LVDDQGSIEHLRVIERSGKHLLDLINNILDLSKIEAGEMQPESTACSPLKILGNALSVMQVRAREKGIVLRESCDTPVPQTIFSDPLRIQQVLLNLIGNAIKFTESGWVHVSVRFSDERTRIDFRIQDTGIGIAEEHLSEIFKPFIQADPSMTRKHDGTGLGLSISHRIARLLRGDLTVESRIGQGSVFTFSLPCNVAPGAAFVRRSPSIVIQQDSGQKERQELKKRHRRILVADDTPEIQGLVRSILEQSGAQVDVVANGAEAVERCSQTAFDLVVMDIQMPIMDGFEALETLRRRNVRVPVIALTAHAMKGDRERCLEAGFTAYVSKPVGRRTLLETVAAVA